MSVMVEKWGCANHVKSEGRGRGVASTVQERGCISGVDGAVQVGKAVSVLTTLDVEPCERGVEWVGRRRRRQRWQRWSGDSRVNGGGSQFERV